MSVSSAVASVPVSAQITRHIIITIIIVSKVSIVSLLINVKTQRNAHKLMLFSARQGFPGLLQAISTAIVTYQLPCGTTANTVYKWSLHLHRAHTVVSALYLVFIKI